MFLIDLPIQDMEISFTPDVVADKLYGRSTIINCEAGKPTGAKDLALDKISASKYSYNLGGVVQRRGKVTEKWRRKTMGQMPLG